MNQSKAQQVRTCAAQPCPSVLLPFSAHVRPSGVVSLSIGSKIPREPCKSRPGLDCPKLPSLRPGRPRALLARCKEPRTYHQQLQSSDNGLELETESRAC